MIRLSVLFDIFLGYVLLLPNFFLFGDILPVKIHLYFSLVLMLWNSLVFHYLTLHIHAGSHYEISKNKFINDTISDLLIGFPFLIGVKSYRRKHNQHHKFFGTVSDAENSYTYAVNLNNFFGHVLLIVPINKVCSLLFCQKMHGAKLAGKASVGYSILSLSIFLSLQLLIVEAFFTNGMYVEYFLVVFVPLFMMLPTLGWLRTVAEHRDYKYVDCSSVVLRNFKSDFIGFFLGAAGFKDHDLHHMYAGVSYKDFDLLVIKKNPVRLEPTSYSKVLMQMIACRDKP